MRTPYNDNASDNKLLGSDINGYDDNKIVIIVRITIMIILL